LEQTLFALQSWVPQQSALEVQRWLRPAHGPVMSGTSVSPESEEVQDTKKSAAARRNPVFRKLCMGGV
jgi:hypothetical protein